MNKEYLRFIGVELDHCTFKTARISLQNDNKQGGWKWFYNGQFRLVCNDMHEKGLINYVQRNQFNVIYCNIKCDDKTILTPIKMALLNLAISIRVNIDLNN
jgi:hypothetical protein